MKSYISFLLLALGAVCQAQVTVIAGPGDFQQDEIVVFNDPGLLQTGPMIQGITNQSAFVVDFWDAGVDLETPSGGQARVQGVNNQMFDTMRVALDDPNADFGTFVVNVNAAFNGHLTFNVGYHALGSSDLFTETFDIDPAGENFFKVRADLGYRLNSVQLVSDVDIQDLRQIRLGGAAPVPEPASIAALAIGAITLLRRRRK